MVAESAVAQELPQRDCWWDVDKQKVGTAVMGDPFLQGVLSWRMCHSLWALRGLLPLWFYVAVDIMSRKSIGVWLCPAAAFFVFSFVCAGPSLP